MVINNHHRLYISFDSRGHVFLLEYNKLFFGLFGVYIKDDHIIILILIAGYLIFIVDDIFFNKKINSLYLLESLSILGGRLQFL